MISYKNQFKLFKGNISMWLSNKYNLTVIYSLSLFCIGSLLYNKLTFIEMSIIYILIGLMTMVMYIFGVSKGMFLFAVKRDEFENLMKKLMKEDDNKDV